MKNEIENLIKTLFRTKGEFCRSIGCRSSDRVQRINSFLSSVERLDKFLKPLGKRLTLTDLEDEEVKD